MDTNTVTEQHGYVPGFLTQCEVPIYALFYIYVFGTTGNVIILIIIICNKAMRAVPSMYIINLAISDMIYLTLLFFEVCGRKAYDAWLEYDFMRAFLPFCRRLSVGLSAYSVAVLSIQRSVAVLSIQRSVAVLSIQRSVAVLSIQRSVAVLSIQRSVAVLSIQRYRLTVNPFHVRVSSQPTWRATVAAVC